MQGAQRVNVVITLALLLVARRALAATVVVAPPAQVVAPGSRAPDLRPDSIPRRAESMISFILF